MLIRYAARAERCYHLVMTVEQLVSTMHAQPFRPFTIHTGDGRSFLVKHPDFIARSPSGRTVIVYGDDESHSIVDMLLVTELEIHPPAKPGAAA
jgi:hypothetical protein